MRSDTVRWGILGCAGIARSRFIPALLAARGGDLAAIASRDGAKARSWADEFGAPRAYASYSALLEDAQVDAVYNPLPNTEHHPWTLAAAAAGKHVLCEKPLAATAAEAAEMVAACREHGVAFFEAFVYRYHPQTARLKELLDGGAIGEVRAVQSGFQFVLHGREGNIRMNRELAGGALMDVGCYCINLSRLVFAGEPEAVLARMRVDPAHGVDTTVSAILTFSGGRTAVFNASFDMAGGQWARISGTEGEIFLPKPCHPRGTGRIELVRKRGREELEVPGGDPFQHQIEAFHEHLAGAPPAGPTAADGVANMAVIEAVRAAAATGRQAVPPVPPGEGATP